MRYSLREEGGSVYLTIFELEPDEIDIFIKRIYSRGYLSESELEELKKIVTTLKPPYRVIFVPTGAYVEPLKRGGNGGKI